MITIRCECGKELKVKDELAGRKVRCPGCSEVVAVPEAGGIREKPRPAAPAGKRNPDNRRRPDDFEEEERPRRRPSRQDDEYEEDRPRRPADEDEDYPPRRASKKAGSNTGLIIGLVAGGVLLVVGLGVGLFFVFKGKDEKVLKPVAGGPRGPVNGGGGGPAGINPLAKMQLENNLKQLALTMHIFNDSFRRLPSPGFSGQPQIPESKPLLSWRVAILPYIEEGNLYRQFKLDEPWDSPNNIKLVNMMPPVFQPVGGQPKKDGHTYLQLVTGPGTLYPTLTSKAYIPRSFPDGTSNTIIIVEAAEPVPWTKPADFTIDVRNVMQGNVPKLGALSTDGFFVALGDGSIRFIDRGRVSDLSIRQAFNPADGGVLGPDW